MCTSSCTCAVHRAGQGADSFYTPTKIILHKSLQMSLSVHVIMFIPHTAARDNKQQVKIAHKPSTEIFKFRILNVVCEAKPQFDINSLSVMHFQACRWCWQTFRATKKLEHFRKKTLNIFGQAFMINITWHRTAHILFWESQWGTQNFCQ